MTGARKFENIFLHFQGVHLPPKKNTDMVIAKVRAGGECRQG